MELVLPELAPEELQSLNKQEVQYGITLQEEKLSQMKPNMAAIAEYRKKVIENRFMSTFVVLDSSLF